VIGNAQIVDTLDEALAGCSLVVGTSARSRTLPWPMLDPRECGLKSVAEGKHAPVALVFGRERVGLTNDELQKCHYHVAIAANPEYSSLNLAMAVQVIAYEVRMAWLATEERTQREQEERRIRWWMTGAFLRSPGADAALHRFYP
jgi:tRNA (cytidine32/uridine32-2'-O)-methyltransferase